MRRLRLALLALAILVAGCTNPSDEALDEGELTLRLASALRPFDACDELLDHVRGQALAHIGPFGLPGGAGGFREDVTTAMPLASGAVQRAVREGSPADAGGESAPGTPGISGTNVQEAGVDEPDTVKTDGRRIFAVARGRLQILEVADGRHRLAGSLALPTSGSHELLLAGDRLLVLSSSWAEVPLPLRADTVDPGIGRSPLPGAERTSVTLVDVSDAAHPRILSTLEVGGHVLGARMVGDVARVVTSAGPAGLVPQFPTGPSPAEESRAAEGNRRQVAQSTLANWLPAFRLELADAQPGHAALSSGLLVECERVSRPAEFSGLGTISVLTFDLSESLGTGDAVTVLADGQTVYASADALYVATSRIPVPGPMPAASPEMTTEIHKFDITASGPARHVASGRVRGHLLNQFSMSEHDGRLRVATTEGFPGADGGSESLVTVLEDRAGTLATVGEVGDLGRGERIYAVRFQGEVGYVVTFRQTDPLYTIDLSDPARPRVVGELKIPGYSAYLHPVGEDLLLGVGQDATEQGRRLGAQVSLFDVSDPAHPERLDQAALGQGSTQAEFDHHAFLWWAPRGLAVLPVQLFEDTHFTGAVGFSVGRGQGLAEVGRVTHAGPAVGEPPDVRPQDTRQFSFGAEWAGTPIQRSLVIGDTLYTLSERGVLASSAGDLAPQGWVGF